MYRPTPSRPHPQPQPPRKYSWYSFLLETESTPGAIVRPEGLSQRKIIPSGDRTRDFRACRVVPQGTAPPPALSSLDTAIKLQDVAPQKTIIWIFTVVGGPQILIFIQQCPLWCGTFPLKAVTFPAISDSFPASFCGPNSSIWKCSNVGNSVVVRWLVGFVNFIMFCVFHKSMCEDNHLLVERDAV